FLEANLLGETLRAQRLGAMEATALLKTVMGEIDVAVFAFDEEGRTRLVNRAGERLLASSAERLLGRTAEQVGLAEVLAGETPRRGARAIHVGVRAAGAVTGAASPAARRRRVGRARGVARDAAPAARRVRSAAHRVCGQRSDGPVAHQPGAQRGRRLARDRRR